MAGKQKLGIPIEQLQQNLDKGCLDVTNLTIYCDLIYLQNIFEYMETRINYLPFNPHTFITEYQLGHQLSKKYNLKTFNNIPHTTEISSFYKHSLDVLNKYQITKKELEENKIKHIYNRIIDQLASNKTPSTLNVWKNVHHTILPNYLKSFNYKLIWNLLPFKTQYKPFNLDNPQTICPFCKKGPDSSTHIFVKCKLTQNIRNFVQCNIKNLTKNNLNLTQNLKTINYVFPTFITHNKNFPLIILLLSISNHQIWKQRYKMIYDNEPYDQQSLITSIKKIFDYLLQKAKSNLNAC